MNILIICIILILIQLSIYFLLNSLGILRIDKLIKNPFNSRRKVTEIEVKHFEIIGYKSTDKRYALLSKNLSHLEFISEFEFYLEGKNYKKFPIDILQEFEQLKTKAQLSTLKSTNQLNDGISPAA